MSSHFTAKSHTIGRTARWIVGLKLIRMPRLHRDERARLYHLQRAFSLRYPKSRANYLTRLLGISIEIPKSFETTPLRHATSQPCPDNCLRPHFPDGRLLSHSAKCYKESNHQLFSLLLNGCHETSIHTDHSGIALICCHINFSSLLALFA